LQPATALKLADYKNNEQNWDIFLHLGYALLLGCG
jgi:hypothetical protein